MKFNKAEIPNWQVSPRRISTKKGSFSFERDKKVSSRGTMKINKACSSRNCPWNCCLGLVLFKFVLCFVSN